MTKKEKVIFYIASLAVAFSLSSILTTTIVKHYDNKTIATLKADNNKIKNKLDDSNLVMIDHEYHNFNDLLTVNYVDNNNNFHYGEYLNSYDLDNLFKNNKNKGIAINNTNLTIED